MTTSRIETRAAWLWIDERGTARVETKPHVHETLQHAIENVQAFRVLTGSDRRAVLVDARELMSQDKEASEHYRSGFDETHILCAAYVIPSRIGALLGNLFLPKNPVAPMRLFPEIEPALRWLSEQVEARSVDGAVPERTAP